MENNTRKGYSYFLSSSITVPLLCIQQLLHVSAFPINHHQATHYIKHKYVYREILFAISQIYMIITFFLCVVTANGARIINSYTNVKHKILKRNSNISFSKHYNV